MCVTYWAACFSKIGLEKAQFVKDHYHLKTSVWRNHIGDVLYNKYRSVLEDALDCETKEVYDINAKKVYENFAAYPEYVKYFKKYFSDLASIARYHIMSICGSLGTISSAAAEQCHASNEWLIPTKIMGIASPEHQMLPL